MIYVEENVNDHSNAFHDPRALKKNLKCDKQEKADFLFKRLDILWLADPLNTTWYTLLANSVRES